MVQAHRTSSNFVVFEHSKKLYTIVGEKTADTSPGEKQNSEERLGVRRKTQTARLGFTCNKESVPLRVLLAEENPLRFPAKTPAYPVLPSPTPAYLIQPLPTLKSLASLPRPTFS